MNAFDNDLHLTRNLAQESANRASYLRSLTGRNILFGSAALAAGAGAGLAAMIWAWNSGLDPKALEEALKHMPALTVNPVKLDPSANEVKVADGGTVKLTPDTLHLDTNTLKLDADPLTLAPGQTVTLDADTLAAIIKKTEQRPVVQPDLSKQPQTTKNGDVIKRELTVFTQIEHGVGWVTTGWTYHDGEGKAPFKQFCYYSTKRGNEFQEKTTYIGLDGKQTGAGSQEVPDLNVAYSKCDWFNGVPGK